MRQVNVLSIGDADRRAAVKQGLQGQGQVRVAGEITESQALPLVPQLQADVIVLDFSATRVNGLAALPWLAGLPGAPAIIVLGASGIPAERRWRWTWARGYLPPDSPAQALRGLVAAPPPLPYRWQARPERGLSRAYDRVPQPVILLVEDEADLARVIQRELDAAGYRVVRAADGLEALRLHATHQPDLIPSSTGCCRS